MTPARHDHSGLVQGGHHLRKETNGGNFCRQNQQVGDKRDLQRELKRFPGFKVSYHEGNNLLRSKIMRDRKHEGWGCGRRLYSLLEG